MSGFTRGLLGKPEFEGISAVIDRWSGEHGAKKNFPGETWPNNTMQGLIQAACGPSGTIVDIGCGVGRCAPLFAPNRYTGVDINETAIDKAKKANPTHTFKLCDWAGPFPKADTALFSTVLLHVPDVYLERMAAACREMKRIVIYETMSRELRESGNEYQRNPLEYRMAFGKLGLKCTQFEWDGLEHFPFFANLMVLEV